MASNNAVVDRQQVIRKYQEIRGRTNRLFSLLHPDAYYANPIPLRHPAVFYEGHIPAFAVNSFLKKGLGHSGLDEALERLFARGIDPSERDAETRMGTQLWPSRETVHNYVQNVDNEILRILETGTIESDTNPVLYRGQGVFTMLEHEVMHQETMLYMWHRFEPDQKFKDVDCEMVGVNKQSSVSDSMLRIPTGVATLGAEFDDIPFGWDNEFPVCRVDVPAFEIDVYNVTNAEFLCFVESGGYDDPHLWQAEAWERRVRAERAHPLFWEERDGAWVWRGMFQRVPLPLAWPVYVSHDEASAFAKWKGLRLPTESEFHRAAYGSPDGTERSYPWGEEDPSQQRGNFDFYHWDPVPVGSYPKGASAWGIYDLVGNGWEWTSTVFGGFPGFQAMASYPEYSADFFDGEHFVAKGASPGTGIELIRRSFRNWFRPGYPYPYATFRCVRDIG